MISHTVILSVLINLLESISQYDISHMSVLSVSMSLTVILSVLINLLESISVSMISVSHSDIVSINKPTQWKVSVESISQYDVSHSDIVSINKPTGKYQPV